MLQRGPRVCSSWFTMHDFATRKLQQHSISISLEKGHVHVILYTFIRYHLYFFFAVPFFHSLITHAPLLHMRYNTDFFFCKWSLGKLLPCQFICGNNKCYCAHHFFRLIRYLQRRRFISTHGKKFRLLNVKIGLSEFRLPLYTVRKVK